MNFVGKKVIISARNNGHNLHVPIEDINGGLDELRVDTCAFSNKTTFEVIQVENKTNMNAQGSPTPLVAFKVFNPADNSELVPAKYLTLPLYGDRRRAEVAEALEEGCTSLLPEHIPPVIAFAVSDGTDADNFEGAGYDYTPMTANPANGNNGQPGYSQVFTLEEVHGYYGIRSLHGKYWRSQWWKEKVSQAPHCSTDEQWRIKLESIKVKTKKLNTVGFKGKNTGKSKLFKRWR